MSRSSTEGWDSDQEKMKMIRVIFIIFLTLLITPLSHNLYITNAEGYGPTTHIYVADQVLQEIKNGNVDLQDNVKQAILANPNSFYAGSLGPDMLEGQHSHTIDAAGIGDRLVNLALQSGDPQNIAYAYGYLVHMGGDMGGHPLVNNYAGGVAYNYNESMYTGGSNTLHVAAEGEIDNRVNQIISNDLRNNIHQLLSAGTHGAAQIGNYVKPELMAQAVNQPNITKDNVYADYSKPIKAYNAEYAQVPVSGFQQLVDKGFDQSKPGEILDSIKDGVKHSIDLIKNPNNLGFINLDDGRSISTQAINQYYTSLSNRPDGSIDSRYLGPDGRVSLQYQQQLLAYLTEKYPNILQERPDLQIKHLQMLGANDSRMPSMSSQPPYLQSSGSTPIAGGTADITGKPSGSSLPQVSPTLPGTESKPATQTGSPQVHQISPPSPQSSGSTPISQGTVDITGKPSGSPQSQATNLMTLSSIPGTVSKPPPQTGSSQTSQTPPSNEEIANQIIKVIKDEDNQKGIIRTEDYYNDYRNQLIKNPAMLVQASEIYLGYRPAGILPPQSLPASTITPGYGQVEQMSQEGTKDVEQMSQEGTRNIERMK